MKTAKAQERNTLRSCVEHLKHVEHMMRFWFRVRHDEGWEAGLPRRNFLKALRQRKGMLKLIAKSGARYVKKYKG